MPRIYLASVGDAKIAQPLLYQGNSPSDLEGKVVLDILMTTTRKHDTQIAPYLIRGNRNSLTADKGYDDQELRAMLQGKKVRPLIQYRVFKHHDRASNARDGSKAPPSKKSSRERKLGSEAQIRRLSAESGLGKTVSIDCGQNMWYAT